MKFHLIEKANPRDLQASKKWYANPINDGKITEDHLAKKIAGRSLLTTGDVSSVIKNLLDEMPEYLLMSRHLSGCWKRSVLRGWSKVKRTGGIFPARFYIFL